MNKMLWGALIAAGSLLARIACLEVDAGREAAGAAPEALALVLLTGGLLAGLLGITGLLGLLGWVPLPGTMKK